MLPVRRRAVSRSVWPVVAAVVAVALSAFVCHCSGGEPDGVLARAMALSAKGVWLEGAYEGREEEAAAAYREALDLVPSAWGPARALAGLLDARPEARVRVLSGLARETNCPDDWMAALFAATHPEVPDDLFLEASAAFARSEAPPAPAPRGVREALLAWAWLKRDPGSECGPRFFRDALVLDAAAPGVLRPDRLYAAFAEEVRTSDAPFPVRAVAALRLDRVMRGNIPAVFQMDCLKVLAKCAGAWREMGDGAASLADALERRLLETVRLLEGDALAEVDAGNALNDAGDVEGALRVWADALARHPPCAPILANNMAYVTAISGGDLDEALRLADIAVSARPSQPSSLDTLAWVFHLRGDAADAAITMRKALQCGGASSHEICQHASEIAAAAGNRSAARHWREMAAKLRRTQQ